MDERPANGWIGISLARAVSRTTSHFDTPVRSDRSRLDYIVWFRGQRIWNTLDAAHESHIDLQKTGNLRAVQLLLGHTKMNSTVRYLGVELEDALAIAEAIEI